MKRKAWNSVLALFFGLYGLFGQAAEPRLQFQSAVSYPVGLAPASVATGDFNDDGKADLAVAGKDSEHIELLLGNGDGTFGKGMACPVGKSCFLVVAGDFNQDGHSDLLVAKRAPSSIIVLKGLGSGQFLQTTNLSLPFNPASMALADLNGDGSLDLVIPAEPPLRQMAIFLGDNHGNFVARKAREPEVSTFCVGVGDATGDGIPDIFLPNASDCNGHVLWYGDGAGGVSFSKGLGPECQSHLSVVSADLNRDGRHDFAMAINGAIKDSLLIRYSQADGQFKRKLLDGGPWPSYVTAADLNADGALDLITVNSHSDQLSVLQGRTDGSFADARIVLPVGQMPMAVAIADFDGDGRADLASANLLERSVSVLIQQTGSISGGEIAHSALAQDPATEYRLHQEQQHPDFKLDTWTTEDGLPQSTVNCVLQTKNGYIWVGTRDGLARYDGLRFTTYTLANTPAFKNANCLSLAEDIEGALWVGTLDGFLRLKEGVFTHYSTGFKGKVESRVVAMASNPGGGVWVGNGHGLRLFRDEKFGPWVRRPSTEGTGQLSSILKLHKGKTSPLCAGTSKGCFEIDDVSCEAKTVFSERPFDEWHRNTPFQDRLGNLWYGSPFGLLLSSNRTMKVYRPAPGLAYGTINGIGEGVEGTLWLATTDKGLVRFRAGCFETLDREIKLPDKNFNCVLVDREGNVWGGTQSSGLVRLRFSPFRSYTKEDGLGHDSIHSISPSADGGVLVATGAGFNRLVDGKFIRPFLGTNDWINTNVHSVYQDSAGIEWVAGPILLRIDGQRVVHFPLEPLGHYSSVSCIYEDTPGSLWLANAGAVSHCLKGTVEACTRRDGLSDRELTAIVRDTRGTIWIGTKYYGLDLLEGDKFNHLTQKDGLLGNYCAPVLADPDGTVWIVTARGVNLGRSNQIVASITSKDGLADDVILNALEDDFGFLWMNGNRGIQRVSKQELLDFAFGKITHVHSALFGVRDGMVSAEGNGGYFPNSCKTKDGRLWFPTIKGVVTVNPSDVEPLQRPPPVVIEQVTANNQILLGDGISAAHKITRGSAMAQFAPGQAGVLQIRYTAPCFGNPRKVLFRHKLEGVENEWSEPSDVRTVTYPNLKPGSYLFRVIACNDHGVWNEEGALFAFAIQPHFYETWTFYLLAGAGIAGLGWGLHLWRLRYVTRVEGLKQDLALERERLRIAHDIHDDVGSRLLQLSVLGELVQRNLEEPKQARPHLEKLNQTSKEIFRAMDEIVWTVNPRQDSVEGLAFYIREYATEFLSPAGIHCRFAFPSVIPDQPLKAEVRHHLFLLVKEALNNVLKHAKATEVWIRLRLEAGTLTLSFEDNGCGFGAQSENITANGNGLSSMHNRIQELHGQVHLESQPGKGTRVTFTLTLQP